jgi:phytoene dehydrogenase-like protein
MIERLFRPFLGGIFLEPELTTSSRMFEFVFRMFSLGEAAIPRLGMEEIPRQLASRLPRGSIRLRAPVQRVLPGGVEITSGELLEADMVLLATDAASLPYLVESPDSMRLPEWCGVTCLYFAADRPPVQDPILVLNGEGDGPINNLCVPSQLSSDLAPPRRALVSVSVLGTPPGDGIDPGPVDEVRSQLEAWFGPTARDWSHLATYTIPRALPRQGVGWLDPMERSVHLDDGVFVLGDHRETASSHGALRSGRRGAEAALAWVRRSSRP